VVLYDGSPFHPAPQRLIDLIDDERISVFGTSPKYLATLESSGVKPRHSHELGSLKTLLCTGSALSPQSYDFVYQHATEGLKKVLPTAEKHQVRLGIENVWNKFLLSPIEMRDFIDQFNSPWIGAYVDVANVVPFGFAEQWIRILGPRVAGVHFKDYRKAVGTIEGFVDLLEGDVNYAEVVKALEEIGYKGPVPAEMIPGYKTHPMVRIANTSRAMDAILGR